MTNFKRAVKNMEKVTVRDVQDSERAFLLSGIDKKILYFTTSLIKARTLERQFSSLGKRVLILSSLLDVISYKASVNETLDTLCGCLNRICLNDVDVVIALPDLLMQRLPNKQVYESCIVSLMKGVPFNFLNIKQTLFNLGYKYVDRVENPCEFADRGDILDVFPLGCESAYRIDFWGDDIEFIKKIDLATYTSSEEVESLDICPCTLNVGKVNTKNLTFLDSEPNIKEKVLNNMKDNSLIYALPAYDDFNSNLVEWFEGGVIGFDEARRVAEIANASSINYINDLIREIEENLLDKVHLNFYANIKNLQLGKNQCLIAFSNLDVKNPLFFTETSISLPTVYTSNYVNKTDILINDLQYFRNQNFTVVLCYKTEEQKQILQTILKNKNLPFVVDDFQNEKFNIMKNEIAYSVGFMNEKFVAISKYSLFKEQKKQAGNAQKSRVFYLPKIGDYVVHQTYGIGICKDIKTLQLGYCEKDYIIIEYLGGDILYLPTEHTDEISQYLGGNNPKLDKLGGDRFAKAREKAKESLKKLAFNLKELYAKRSALKGHKYSEDNFLVDEFQKACGFELTQDQTDAINDIKADMENGKIMDRLICGDVGFGKTEVAMVGAFKTVVENKQVAFLAPTTILCHQHYETIKNRTKDFMVRVGMLSRFNTKKENDAIIKKLQAGEIDIVCGTHRMLSDDVRFKDLGLLILDEEQRFGVADKEKIKRLKQNVNVITLSATPIPRTLQMSLIGARDTSLITTPPKSRVPITTIVCEYSPSVLQEACRRELSRDGQVLIVYNRVESIYNFASQVRKLLPDVEIDVAHGQMDKNALENAILKLYSKETQILIATTLIENGVDLPMANTIFIINADTLGLSQLYQLRGRVGRGNRNSYAYFTFDRDKIVNEVAFKRLEALKEFSELGSGFKIAMRDLEIRGAGTLLGAEQSGHIEKIGYDLYCKMLEEALTEMNENGGEMLRDVKIEIAQNAYISPNYVPSEAERIKLYSDIAQISTEEEVQTLIKKLSDIYGVPNDSVLQLIQIGFMKNLAKKCGIKKVVINDIASFAEFYEDKQDNEQKARMLALEVGSNIHYESGLKNRILLNKGQSIKERQISLTNFLLKLIKVVA